jgi:hypothetical protein
VVPPASGIYKSRHFLQVSDSEPQQRRWRARGAAGVLTRKFTYSLLYTTETDYFATQRREVLHTPSDPINFDNLWCARGYPHALANCILHSSLDQQLELYEIGGGSGLNALLIFNYLEVSCRSLEGPLTGRLTRLLPRQIMHRTCSPGPSIRQYADRDQTHYNQAKATASGCSASEPVYGQQPGHPRTRRRALRRT